MTNRGPADCGEAIVRHIVVTLQLKLNAQSSCAAPASAASTATASAARRASTTTLPALPPLRWTGEIMLKPEVDTVVVVAVGSDVLKILRETRQVRFGDVRQQTCRRRVNSVLRDLIVIKRKTAKRIDDCHRRVRQTTLANQSL